MHIRSCFLKKESAKKRDSYMAGIDKMESKKGIWNLIENN